MEDKAQNVRQHKHPVYYPSLIGMLKELIERQMINVNYGAVLKQWDSNLDAYGKLMSLPKTFEYLLH